VYTATQDFLFTNDAREQVVTHPLRFQSGYPMHGDILFPGRLGNADTQAGFLMNVGEQMTFNMPTSIVGQVWAYHVKTWENGEWEEDLSDQWTPGDHGATSKQYLCVDAPKYVSFSFNYPGISATGVNYHETITTRLDTGVGTTDGSNSFCQHALPDFAQNVPAVKSVKVLGASIMFTNTSEQISRNGSVAVAQVPCGNSWMNYLGEANLSKLNKERNAVMSIEDGSYVFLKPSSPTDVFSFSKEYTLYNPDSPLQVINLARDPVYETAFFNLIEPCEFIVTNLVIAPSYLGVVSGYWTFAFKCEYNSDDRWRSLQFGNVLPESTEAALALVSAAPQFHKNDFHISDIWKWIVDVAKSVTTGIVKHGPGVLKVASTLAPFLPLL